MQIAFDNRKTSSHIFLDFCQSIATSHFAIHNSNFIGLWLALLALVWFPFLKYGNLCDSFSP